MTRKIESVELATVHRQQSAVPAIAPWSYVIDTGDSPRFYQSVYQVVRLIDADMALCRHVGHLQNGRLDCSGFHGESYRKLANLRVRQC